MFAKIILKPFKNFEDSSCPSLTERSRLIRMHFSKSKSIYFIAEEAISMHLGGNRLYVPLLLSMITLKFNA